MTTQTRQIIQRALEQHRSDDSVRARAAFAGCTPSQMQEEYGQSGRTRQQLLDGYVEHERAVNAALTEMAQLEAHAIPLVSSSRIGQ